MEENKDEVRIEELERDTEEATNQIPEGVQEGLEIQVVTVEVEIVGIIKQEIRYQVAGGGGG